MDTIFWIISIVVSIFFVIFALARASATYESEEKKAKLEQSISNVASVLLYPLISIGILISTISTLISIWS